MVVKRAALLFHSFCSNVSKQAARFCRPLYWSFTRDTTACNIMNVFVKESRARPLIKQPAVSRFSSKIIGCTRTTRAARTRDARNEVHKPQKRKIGIPPSRAAKIKECTCTTQVARTRDARNEGIRLRRENRNSALACGKDKRVHTHYASSKDTRRERA